MINSVTSNAAVADGAAAAANGADTAALANAAATAAQAEWQAGFCARFATLLFEYGRWFLLAALIIGAIGAIAAIVKLFRTDPVDGEAGGGILSDSVAALTALIDSLAKAPTWIAMLGAALALFWMSGHAQPTFCDSCGNSVTENDAATANGSSASDRNAANESEGDSESGG